MSHTRTRSLIVTFTLVLCVPSLLAKPEAKKWVGVWASAPLLDAHVKNAEELLAAGTQSGATLRMITQTLGEIALRLALEEGLRAMTVNAVTRHTLTQRLIEMIGFTTTGTILPSSGNSVFKTSVSRLIFSG